MTDGLAASVQARLLNRAKARGEDFSLVLSRYAVERFLYRLSVSPDRDRYWLKGALLFDLWLDVHALAREGALDAQSLAEAIAATFARRGTTLPSDVPLGLSREFARDAAKANGAGGVLIRCFLSGLRKLPLHRRENFGAICCAMSAIGQKRTFALTDFFASDGYGWRGAGQ